MNQLIEALPPGARVLDLGARGGSFSTPRSDLTIVRLDLEIPARPSGCYVRADAACLPFASSSFDLVVSNHSLEHFVELEAVLREVGGVIRPGGCFYAAVPDSTTWTDRIYRWLGKGGGHVNAFRWPADVIVPVESITGLKHCHTGILYSSLSFLNAHNFVDRPPRKIAFFGFGNERFLAVLLWLLRRFGPGSSRYGWEFYFGPFAPPDHEPWINVCVRCGSGHSEPYLRGNCAIHKLLFVETYRCPACGGFNLLTSSAP